MHKGNMNHNETGLATIERQRDTSGGTCVGLVFCLALQHNMALNDPQRAQLPSRDVFCMSVLRPRFATIMVSHMQSRCGVFLLLAGHASTGDSKMHWS